MAHKTQHQDEKHPYASPTTPGLYVTFRNYIIELVCLNTNHKIGPRFWSEQGYWAPKYRREVRGVFNLSNVLDFTKPLTQTALVQIITEYRIKALIAKKTVDRVVRLTNKRITKLSEQREVLSKKHQQVDIDSKKNSTFIDTGKKNTLSKIREAENG